MTVQLAQSKAATYAAAWFFIPIRKIESKKVFGLGLLGNYGITAKIVNRAARTSLGAEAAGGACTFRLFDFVGRQLSRALATQYSVRHDLLLSVPQGLLDYEKLPYCKSFLISGTVLDPNQETTLIHGDSGLARKSRINAS